MKSRWRERAISWNENNFIKGLGWIFSALPFFILGVARFHDSVGDFLKHHPLIACLITAMPLLGQLMIALPKHLADEPSFVRSHFSLLLESLDRIVNDKLNWFVKVHKHYESSGYKGIDNGTIFELITLPDHRISVIMEKLFVLMLAIRKDHRVKYESPWLKWGKSTLMIGRALRQKVNTLGVRSKNCATRTPVFQNARRSGKWLSWTAFCSSQIAPV